MREGGKMEGRTLETQPPSAAVGPKPTPSSWNEAECLAYDPFAGDDYGGGFVDRGSKIVTSRGEYECHICQGPIAKRERHRVDSCILDGEWLTARFCSPCCAAMALSWTDDGRAIEAREP